MTSPQTKQSFPFGLWPSPISARLVSQQVRLQDVQWGDGQTLVWLEGRSDQSVLVAKNGSDAPRILTDEQPVQGRVGYGGGDFTAVNGAVIFAARDGRLYRKSLGSGFPSPITPGFGVCASPALSPDGRWALYVFNQGDIDLLGIVDAEGRGWPQKLAQGADFYMQPTWRPDGAYVAWIEWDHPNMPWDGTRLKLGRVEGSPPRLVEETLIDGDEDTPILQPEFSPDGRYLSYITGRGEWDQLTLLDLQSGERRTLIAGEGYNVGAPAWTQGVRVYGWSPSSERIFYTRIQSARASLWVVELDSGETRPVVSEPYTWISQVSVSPAGDQVAFIGSAPSIPNRVMWWDGSQLHTAAYSQSENVPSGWIAEPRQISWQAPDGSPVYGSYYPPTNPNAQASGLPPAIVHVHGGPTSMTPERYNAEVTYFTSRGYAWLELNYRGSTGYGRSYQKALLGRWGEVDVEDAAGAAQALVAQGLADARKLVVMGGSAGGYTVLNALVQRPGLLKAGVCLYGVSNLFTLNMDTHKFEARYNDSLVGPLPEAAERYHAWSPVFHADRISDPLAIFQGSEDKVVPPSQSESIVQLLKQRNVPHLYKLYEGEGHGFRKTETIADFLRETERFLQQYVLFAA